jgi:hypothetical protein
MSARIRVLIAALAFAGWIAWLGYLAATALQPIVLSRPQLLVSTLDVIAEVGGDPQKPDSTVIIKKVHWPPKDLKLPDKITVNNLAHCEGWKGPGEYILPLVQDGDHYRVIGIPPSPGYSGKYTIPAGVTSRGMQAVTPASMTGIRAGLQIVVDVGSAQETVTVSALTSTTFTATFSNTHEPYTILGDHPPIYLSTSETRQQLESIKKAQ